MTAYARDTITPVTPAWPTRRAEAGSIRLSQRAIDGLITTRKHYCVPLDLPGTAFNPEQPL